MDKKKLVILVALVMVIGIVVSLTAGFNIDMMTRAHEQVTIKIEKDFDIGEVKNLAKEVINAEVEVQKAEVYKDQVVISSKKISEEQKNELVTKINEKFEKQIETKDVNVVSISKVKLFDLVSPYIWEFILITILISLYVAFRFRKLGSLKAVVQMVLGIVISEILVFSLIAIVRIPLGKNIAAIVFATYTIATFALTAGLEKQYAKLKLESKKKKE